MSRSRGPVAGEELAGERPRAEIEDEDVGRVMGEPAAEPELMVEASELTASDSETRGVKTRRGKGRMRKARAVAESPGATATWIQIGPGKFVRVESPGSPVVATSPNLEGEAPGEPAGDPAGSLTLSSGTAEASTGAPLPPDGDGEDAAPFVAAEPEAPPAASIPEVEDTTAPGEPSADEAVSIDAGGDPARTIEPEHPADAAPAGADELGSHPDVEVPPTADLGVACGAGVMESEVEVARDEGEQALAESGESVFAEETPATAPGMDAGSEHEPESAADAARDNGIAPDAFADTTGDNGIAPDAFVDIAPTGIETEHASSQDRDASPPSPTDDSRPSHRPTVGTLLNSWLGAGRARVARQCGGPERARRPQHAMPRRSGGPGFPRPSNAAAGGRRYVRDNHAEPFPHARPRTFAARSRAREEHGDGPGCIRRQNRRDPEIVPVLVFLGLPAPNSRNPMARNSAAARDQMRNAGVWAEEGE